MVSNRAKSLFSQLLWIMKPEIMSITGSTFFRSHSPRRENGRAGSARSKDEDETPGLSRSPRMMPEDCAENRVN